MRPGAEVADKAVSTDDLEYPSGDEAPSLPPKGEGDDVPGAVTAASTAANTTGGYELVRLEAVLAALVESKVVAIKASTSKDKKVKDSVARQRSHSDENPHHHAHHHHHHHGPPPTGSSHRHQRLASTSTGSSSFNDHHHHHHHHKHRHHRKRQSDGALLASGLFPRKRYRHHHHHRHRYPYGDELEALRDEETEFGPDEVEMPMVPTVEVEMDEGLEETFEEDVPTAGPSTARSPPPHHQGYHNYNYFANQLQQRRVHHHVVLSASCCSSPAHSAAPAGDPLLHLHHHHHHQLDTEYVSLSMECEDDLAVVAAGAEDMDALDTLPVVATATASRARKKRRRKQRVTAQQQRRRRQRAAVAAAAAEAAAAQATAAAAAAATRPRRRPGGVLDPDDLPKRARWTIIATACLLLLMSVLLVGVTLRMAPIIDEMVRKENEELMSAITRGGMYNNSAASNAPLEVSSTPDP